MQHPQSDGDKGEDGLERKEGKGRRVGNCPGKEEKTWIQVVARECGRRDKCKKTKAKRQDSGNWIGGEEGSGSLRKW